MSRKDLEHTIATKMLTGPGLEVLKRLKRTNETMLADAMKARIPDDLADASKVVMEQFKWTPYPNAAAPNTAHSPESITSTIAALESLAETLPAVLTVANGWAPANIKFKNRDAMHSAVDMLRKYRDMRCNDEAAKDRKRDEVEREQHHILIAETFENGVKTGIEQEQARVKEARRGRKRGAKKS